MKKVFLYKKDGRSIVKTDVFATVDDADFERVSTNRWYLMKLYHCNTEILYARRYEGSPRMGNHKAILMHREILGAVKREQKVDHKDGDGLNNTRGNIRICSHSDNMSNRKVSYKKKIGYLGVSLVKKYNKYQAIMKLNGRCYRSSYCETAEDAAIAYNKLVEKHKPEFGKINVL